LRIRRAVSEPGFDRRRLFAGRQNAWADLGAGMRQPIADAQFGDQNLERI
jgi:hypothetical protein